MGHLYPIYLNLKHKNCLVIGGGKVAERKTETLLEYEANVKVVSPAVENRIAEWALQGRIQLKKTVFCEEDLEGAFLVFIATDNNSVNQEITAMCRERNILVNAVDDPPNCDFYVPAVIRRSSLSVAISTEGKSPLFASRLKQMLSVHVPEEYGDFVDMMGAVREKIRNSDLSIEERKSLLYELMDSDILDLVRQGDKQKAEERIRTCISSWQG